MDHNDGVKGVDKLDNDLKKLQLPWLNRFLKGAGNDSGLNVTISGESSATAGRLSSNALASVTNNNFMAAPQKNKKK